MRCFFCQPVRGKFWRSLFLSLDPDEEEHVSLAIDREADGSPTVASLTMTHPSSSPRPVVNATSVDSPKIAIDLDALDAKNTVINKETVAQEDILETDAFSAKEDASATDAAAAATFTGSLAGAFSGALTNLFTGSFSDSLMPRTARPKVISMYYFRKPPRDTEEPSSEGNSGDASKTPQGIETSATANEVEGKTQGSKADKAADAKQHEEVGMGQSVDSPRDSALKPRRLPMTKDEQVG